MKFIKELFRKRKSVKVSANWNDFVFPADILHPKALGVFSSGDISDAWASIYMAKALQVAYPSTQIHIVIHQNVAEFADFLPWTPAVHVYTNSSHSFNPPLPENILFFSPMPGDELLSFINNYKPSACVSFEKHAAVNVTVKIANEKTTLPNKISEMIKILKLETENTWKPAVPNILSEKASSILSPVSHRTLPYIFATESAALILEKKRAEIPLKIVLVDGKASNIPSEISNGMLAAMVGGASVVATTRLDLWIHAKAQGIPVVGIDRKDQFKGWGGDPAKGDTKFLENWANLIRTGW